METLQLSPAIVVLVPIVIGLTALIKMYIGTRFAPLVSLMFGIFASFMFPASTFGLTVLSGIVIGLSASGLYSGVKSVAS